MALGATFLENATIRGSAWYKLLDAPVLTLEATVCQIMLTFPLPYPYQPPCFPTVGQHVRRI